MYYAITLKDGIITGVHESMQPMTAATFASSAYAGHDVVSVPHGNISTDLPLASYHGDWTLKPLSQRVAEGLVTIDDGYVLDGDTIRLMTPMERIDAGLDTPEDPAKNEMQRELAQLHAWFGWYDAQMMQYQRALRMGEKFDKDIADLDASAAKKQARIREILATTCEETH